jgi:predicted nucleic acid-binding protein
LEIRGPGREEKKRINSQHSRYCKLLKARSFEKKGKKEKKKKRRSQDALMLNLSSEDALQVAVSTRHRGGKIATGILKRLVKEKKARSQRDLERPKR